MRAGETLPECEVCNDKLLNTDVYRNYFNNLFAHKYEEVMVATDATGYTTARPVSCTTGLAICVTSSAVPVVTC
jgi:hypothetical protein